MDDIIVIGERITITEPTECVCCERTVKPHMVMYRIDNERPVPPDLYCSPCWFEPVDEEDVERCTITGNYYDVEALGGTYHYYYDASTYTLREL
jgi:hypothetical protein